MAEPPFGHFNSLGEMEELEADVDVAYPLVRIGPAIFSPFGGLGRAAFLQEPVLKAVSGQALEERPDSFSDDFSQALVCVGDSQIPSQVFDSHPFYGSKVAVTPLHVSDLVAQLATGVAARLATTKKNKNRKEVERALKTEQERNDTMKWLPFMSNFVLEKMCGLIQSGVRTDKGFKKVHISYVAKGLFDYYGVSICSTQVYNHLRKWRKRWLTISRLRDLSGSPKDAELPIANYDEMHTIFSFGLATGKYAIGSSEPLGSAAANPAPEDAETQESDTVNLDGEPDKAADAPEKVSAGKRKRGTFADDELVAFANMTVAVKDVAVG
ncbi:hypothetical protein QYE76_055340 [Lolium multiflorum]|uniref:Uncharacterized protein n=1 Tax=Lolium multiflorum TaxID=4521 RepID=A0AAD8WM80_LOLMU|nr:hypothetical protein QYE76_055340 [Lolium multiflorum]